MNRWAVTPELPKEESKSTEFIRSDPLTVERENTHVYFYSQVNTDRCLALIQKLHYIDGELIQERSQRSLPEDFPKVPIWLHINSYGGSVFSAFGVADKLRQYYSPIYSIVEGCAASAATIISTACDRRYIQPSGFMLIHQISSIFWGTFEEFKDEMHLQDMLMEKLVDMYKEKTNMTKTKIRELLKRDSWFRANECVDLGLVDQILE